MIEIAEITLFDEKSVSVEESNDFNNICGELVSEENGRKTYYCVSETNHPYVINVPSEINSDTQIALYVTGTGGNNPTYKNDNASADEYINSLNQTNPNCIFISPKEPTHDCINERYNSQGELYADVYADSTIKMVDEVLNEYDLDESNITSYVSWSNGGPIATKVAAHYIENEENENGTVTHKNFAYINTGDFFGVIDDNEKKLISNNSTLLEMNESGYTGGFDELASNYGADLVTIDMNSNFSSGHSIGNINFARGGGLPAMLGVADLSLGYSFGHYNHETGEFEAYSVEQANELYKSLSESQKDLLTNSNNIKELPEIKSDDTYLSTSLAEINSMIKSSLLNNISGTEIYSSTTNIPSREPEIISKLFNTSISLYEKLSEELIKINAVGERFKDLDNFLSDMVPSLNINLNSTASPFVKSESFEIQDFTYNIPPEILEELQNLKNENEKEPQISEGIVEEPKQVEPQVQEAPQQIEPEVQEEPKQTEQEVQEEPKQTEPEVQDEPKQTEPEVQEESKQTEPEVQEEPKQTEPEVQEEPKQIKPQVQEEPKQPDPEVQEEPKQSEPIIPEESQKIEQYKLNENKHKISRIEESDNKLNQNIINNITELSKKQNQSININDSKDNRSMYASGAVLGSTLGLAGLKSKKDKEKDEEGEDNGKNL